MGAQRGGGVIPRVGPGAMPRVSPGAIPRVGPLGSTGEGPSLPFGHPRSFDVCDGSLPRAEAAMTPHRSSGHGQVRTMHEMREAAPAGIGHGHHGGPDHSRQGHHGGPDPSRQGHLSGPDHSRQGHHGGPDPSRHGHHGGPDHSRQGHHGGPDHSRQAHHGGPDHSRQASAQLYQYEQSEGETGQAGHSFADSPRGSYAGYAEAQQRQVKIIYC